MENKLPTLKLAAGTLKLNSVFTAQSVQTALWLTQGNADLGTLD